MPILNNVGISTNTPTKQQDFRSVLSLHLKITQAVLNKHQWTDDTYYYFDLTAGPGKYTDGKTCIVGSPLIFLNLTYKMKRHALMVEKNFENYLSLSSYAKTADCRYGDSRLILPNWLQTESHKQDDGVKYGLCYVDPTGDPPPFEMLADASHHNQFTRIDILMYLSATNIKRWRMNPKLSYNTSLIDALCNIDKKHWIIREPKSQHQWTFLLGTNWNAFPPYKNRGFHRVRSKQGQEILRKLNFTAEENNGQTSLPLI